MLLNPQTLRVSCFQASTYMCWCFHAVTKVSKVSPLPCSLRSLHQSELLITQLKPLRVGALKQKLVFIIMMIYVRKNYEMEFQKFYIKSKKQKPTLTCRKILNVQTELLFFLWTFFHLCPHNHQTPCLLFQGKFVCQLNFSITYIQK